MDASSGDDGRDGENSDFTDTLPPLKEFKRLWDDFELRAKELPGYKGKRERRLKTYRREARKILEAELAAILPGEDDESKTLDDELKEIGKQVDLQKKEMVAIADRELKHGKSTMVKPSSGLFGCPEPEVTNSGEFTFERTLGSGGNGNVALWVRRDETGRVADRVAVKEVYMTTKAEWNSSKNFYGEIDDRNSREKVMHSLATSRNNRGQHIVDFRASSLDKHKNLLRIYMESCRYGTLTDVRARFRQVTDLHHLSEPALWAVFESLAYAEHLLAFGHFPEDDRTRDWDLMIHRDIKPGNIFLTDADENRWRHIPKVKLGDFGIAGLEEEDHIQEDFQGTPPYISPEIINLEDYRDDNMRISTPADIWSIGITMLKLMNQRESIEADSKGHYYKLEQDESRLPTIDGPGREYYSEPLVTLVELCLRQYPEERIEVKQLCKRISKEIEALCQQELSEDNYLRFPYADEIAETMQSRPKKKQKR